MAGRGAAAQDGGVDAVITTDRMELRPLSLDDVDLLVELDSDAAVMKYLTGGTPTSAEQWAAHLAARADDEGLVPGRWLARSRPSEEYLGWFALETDGVHPGDERELGYRLRSKFWCRGLATEGSRALVRHGFDELGVHRIWAQTMAVNIASRRVMEKAGLHHVRTFHPHFDEPISGAEHGEVEYELQFAEWVRLHAWPHPS